MWSEMEPIDSKAENRGFLSDNGWKINGLKGSDRKRTKAYPKATEGEKAPMKHIKP